MRASIWSLAAGGLLVTTMALAEEVPDLRGTWTGKTHTIVAGSGGHWPSSKGTFDNPGLFEKAVVFEITGQKDRRFWGSSRLDGEGEDTVEPFVGEFDVSLRRILIADTDGYFWAELLDPHHLTYCYAHAGGRTASTVVSCSEVRRKH